MKTEIYSLTPNEEMVLYYRFHPVEAVKDLLNIDLNWFQRITFRGMWTVPFTLLCYGRGSSKTFLNAVFSVLSGMLYPMRKILVLGPSKRQGDLIFDEIDKLHIKSEFFQATCASRITRAPQESRLKFSNGSSIKSIPIGPDGRKIRGYRAHVMILDEFAQFDKEVIDVVIRPFMAIKMKGEENKLIITSSAFHKWNHFWLQYERYRKLEVEFPRKYRTFEYNYHSIMLDPKSPFEADIQNIEDARENMTESDFNMEYLAIFPSGDTNFFSTFLIDQCTPREPKSKPIEIEKKAQDDSQYIMAIDSAREKGGSNFALGVGKLKDGNLHVVKMITLNGETYQKQISTIRQTLLDFPIELILLDKGGGGSTIKDLLTEPWRSYKGRVCAMANPHGEPMLPILDSEDPDHVGKQGLFLMRMVNFHGSTHSTLFTNLKAEMEHGRIKFPIDLRRDKDQELELLGQNMIALKKELAVLSATPKGAYLHFEVPNNFRSDRACVLAMLAEGLISLTRFIPEQPTRPLHMDVGFFVT